MIVNAECYICNNNIKYTMIMAFMEMSVGQLMHITFQHNELRKRNCRLDNDDDDDDDDEDENDHCLFFYLFIFFFVTGVPS